MPAYQDKARGTWYCTYQVKDKATGRFKTKKKRGFSTRREALAYERKNRYGTDDVTSMSFNQVAEEYFNSKTVAQNTEDIQKMQLRLHFPYAEYKLSSITKSLILEWLQALRIDVTHKTTTKNQVIQLVKAVLMYAEDKYEVSTPSKSLKKLDTPKAERQQRQEMHVWELDQFQTFYNAIDNYVLKTFFEFLYWTGCRKGEARALHKADVDLTAKTVTIKYTIDEVKYGLKEGTKTDSGIRTISIDDTLAEHLKPLMDSEGEFLFYGKAPIDIYPIRACWDKTIKETGLPRIKIHDLRHSHASFLIGHGTPITMVSKRLGHANPSITYKVYAHIIEKNEDELMQLLSDSHK